MLAGIDTEVIQKSCDTICTNHGTPPVYHNDCLSWTKVIRCKQPPLVVHLGDNQINALPHHTEMLDVEPHPWVPLNTFQSPSMAVIFPCRHPLPPLVATTDPLCFSRPLSPYSLCFSHVSWVELLLMPLPVAFCTDTAAIAQSYIWEQHIVHCVHVHVDQCKGRQRLFALVWHRLRTHRTVLP